ncbi:hypothetical protein BGZ98_005092 [Dissophora globulifera]|nr:hypothetical protein BGZ98_005092 [Dissophora globulifera]
MLLGTVTPVNTTGCAPIRFAGSVWGTLTGEGGQPLQACEDVHLHRRSGLVFTACGVAESRKTWFPAAGKFEATSAKIEEEGWLRDELVVYDVAQAGVARAVNIIGFPADVDRVFVGMDVYEDPSVELALSQKKKVKNHKLTLFLINQRRTGSVVEVLEYTFNDKKTRYIETIQHKLVWAPNDILAMGPRSNVVYVSPSETFVAYSGIVSANGITANTDRSLIFVSAIHGAALHVLRTRSPLALSPSSSSSSDDDETEDKVVKKQSLRTHPNRLVSVDYIKLDFYSDNPSFDPDTNSIFVAGHVQPRKLMAGLNIPEVPVQGPSRVVKISPRFKDDEEARKSLILPSFLGLNRYYNVEKVLEDDGSDISTATTAVVDRQRKAIVIGAAFSEKGLLRCPIPEGF